MKKQQVSENKLWEACQELPWYGICRVNATGHISRRTFTCLGPDLLNGFLDEHRKVPFPAGDYAVGTWIPKRKTAMADWGLLRVTGPGSWVLRSKDGRTGWAAGRRGIVVCLRAGGDS